jgi:hypothetical protein
VRRALHVGEDQRHDPLARHGARRDATRSDRQGDCPVPRRH